MTTQAYFQDLGANASCTLCSGLLYLKAKTSGSDTKVCSIKGDAWFGSVQVFSILLAHGIESIFQVTTAHTEYPKKFIDEKMNYMPCGVHLLLEG
jgi:hypothetical protein